jgi:hypothetical protein
MGLFKIKEIKDSEEQLVNDYTSCFSGPAGEAVLKDLYQICGVDLSVFVKAEFDPVQAAFYEGMRYVVLRLLGYSGRKPFNL